MRRLILKGITMLLAAAIVFGVSTVAASETDQSVLPAVCASAEGR
jgi:hypothetical protein